MVNSWEALCHHYSVITGYTSTLSYLSEAVPTLLASGVVLEKSVFHGDVNWKIRIAPVLFVSKSDVLSRVSDRL